ncbi:hypothetical protein G9A89_001387 [Geosiphon pyriformis]|nr:hypothetical protein G9A89_001387 [Geosiphon pyriformis]
MEFYKTVLRCLSAEDLVLRKRLENAWVFNISLANNTIWRKASKPDPYFAIGTWMLRQLFYEKMDLDHIIVTYEHPSPRQVLQLVAKHHMLDLKDITVSLIIDYSPNTIKLLGNELNQAASYSNATITGPVDFFLRSSPRNHIYLLILSLHSPSIFKDGIEYNLFPDDYILNIFVNDCRGHGRDLKVLVKTLNGDKEAQTIARAVLTRQRVNFHVSLLNTLQTIVQWDSSLLYMSGSGYWHSLNFEHFIAKFHFLKPWEIHAGKECDMKFVNHYMDLQIAPILVHGAATRGKNSDIVNSSNWAKYFGPFARRAFNFASVDFLNINTIDPVKIKWMDGTDENQANKITFERLFKDIEKAITKTDMPEQFLKSLNFLAARKTL